MRVISSYLRRVRGRVTKGRNRFITSAFAGVAIVLAGCAQTSDHYALFISPGFSAEQQREIVNAAESWEGAAHVAFTIHVDDGRCSDGPGLGGEWHTLCVVPSTRAANVARGAVADNLARTTRGDATDSATTHMSVDALNAQELGTINHVLWRTVAAHEIGHALGLPHAEGNVLMRAGYVHGQPEAPTAEDVHAFETR